MNLGYLIRMLGKRYNYAIRVNIQHANHSGAVLTVFFNNSDIFQSEFASYSICEGWVKARRNLKGVPVTHNILNLIET